MERVPQKLIEENRRLREVAEALLLFHYVGEWNSLKRTEWFNLTQSLECTAKVLCDMARAALVVPPWEIHEAEEPLTDEAVNVMYEEAKREGRAE